MGRFKNAGEVIEAISLSNIRKHKGDKEYMLQLETDIKDFIRNTATDKEVNEIKSHWGLCEMLAMLCDGYKRHV